jgi:mono/diheme cytochrome c family protein
VSAFDDNRHDRAETLFRNRNPEHNNSHLKRLASILLGAALLAIAGCSSDPSLKTDAELGLNEQQAHGRRVFKLYCAICHQAYSTQPLKGPSLKGLYQKPYLPSGLIANDRFVEQSIVSGRKMMPALGNSLSEQEIKDVIAYLHTL